MPELTHKIEKTEEREFVIDTNDFFRPDLKQIGNSVLDIRNYFCPRDAVQVCIVPEIPKATLKDIHDNLLFLVENSAFFCEPLQVSVGNCDSPEQHIFLKGGLVFLSESITQILNIPDVNRPSSVQCDVIVLLPHQPVSVLTVVDDNSKSEVAVKYNVSIARGVTVALAKFMNECTSPLFGVLDRTVLKFQNSFETHIESFKHCSVLFVTPTSLSMSPMKYDKVQTAFWASVAETTAVTDDAGNDYLRFLTKDQCILLLENIGKQEVIVKCGPGCGGSTLMLEVSKRLSRTGETVIVCDNEEERKRFRKAKLSRISYDELEDLPKSNIQHVVHESGELSFLPHGTVWTFVKTEKSEASCQKAMMEETESQSKDSKLENPELMKQIRPHQDLIKRYLATTGKERFEELRNTLVETKKVGHLEEYLPVDDFKEKFISLLLDIQFPTKDLLSLKAPSFEPEDILVFPVQLEKENRETTGDNCGDQKQNSRGSLYPNVTEAVKALQEDPELFHSIRHDIVDDNRNISYLEEKVAYLKMVVKVPTFRVDLHKEERGEDGQKALASDPDEVKKDVQPEITITQRGRDSGISSHQVYQMRRFQYGNTKQGDMFGILGNVIRDKAIRLPSLQAESDTLEKGFGCPVYIVGEAGSPKSRPLSCPQLNLDKERVNTEVTHISDNNELVNLPAATSDQSKLRFKRYRGTCTSTSIPLPSPYTRFPPCPRYWETRVRGFVKRDVPVWRILFDVGVSEESQLDLKYMQSAQSRSWCFVLADCGMHEGICTKVWAEGALIKCIRNTMTNAPNSYSVHNYGTVLDVWRGRLAFIDLNSEDIIHQFDIDFKEDLYPMIGAWLYPEDYTVCMKWVCGKDISMSDKKKTLIHKALYTHNEQ